MALPKMRVGQGFDVHAFGPGTEVVLGGVKIPHHQGLIAHSDGDVALHALCDALLGAAALGDIGLHFPDTNEAFKGIDSRQLLRMVASKISEYRWQILNVDLTIICQAPKVMPYRLAMRATIAQDLGLTAETINIKATTTEKLGALGRSEGIAAMATVLLWGV